MLVCVKMKNFGGFVTTAKSLSTDESLKMEEKGVGEGGELRFFFVCFLGFFVIATPEEVKEVL